MGIPSYFSYIIKNYSNIICKQNQVLNSNAIQYLFMDCNSIIYDEFRKMTEIDDNIEKTLIHNVIQKISSYISYINPTTLVYIAFDGVAPLAKMEQQRTRRYKSSAQSTSDSSWKTSNITPGTPFMQKLTKQIRTSFNGLEKHFNVSQIIVSGTDECGEGEHKMYHYIRNSNITTNDTIAVYGLDSDLIMLSVFHCDLTNNIFIFRETPVFGKQLIPDNSDNEEYLFLNINTFSHAILREMHCGTNDTHRLYDYIFMCFFLGNDFLPHFPSLNIRTNGIDTLLTTYRNIIIGNNIDHYLISPTTMDIEWEYVDIFIKELAKNEHSRILNEYELREKFGKRKWLVNTIEERDLMIESVPVIYRAEELYIAPSERFWEKRYYKSLFSEHNIENICTNYLEGLEWVFKYYTVDCPDWKWRYNHHYPPLLTDLTKLVPKTKYNFIKNHDKLQNKPFSDMVQLAFVLPPENHSLLPKHVKHDMDTLYSNTFTNDLSYQWAFCRYFWESHAVLPFVTTSQLNEWDLKWTSNKKTKR